MIDSLGVFFFDIVRDSEVQYKHLQTYLKLLTKKCMGGRHADATSPHPAVATELGLATRFKTLHFGQEVIFKQKVRRS